MTIAPPSRSLAAAIALILSIVVAVLIAPPAQTMAQARKAVCTSSSTTHSKRGAHACAQSKHTFRSHGKSKKSHARVKARVHHAKHAVPTAKHADGKKPAAADRTKPPAGTSPIPAICEDGSAPTREASGSFSCDDESEPGCESGSTPVLSSDGSTLLCNVLASDERAG